MTALIRKEFRSLALPAGLVLAAAVVGTWGSTGLSRRWAPLAEQVAGIAFLVGTPLMAALSFGDEFHHRTMVLLLTEPVSRTRVWLEKWLVVVTVVGVVTGIELVVWSIQARDDLPLASAAVYAVMVVCSAPLWTLVARSTIGGLVFTGSVIMMLELAAGLYFDLVLGIHVRPEVFGNTAGLQVVRATYSLVSLGLGWWVFARFQAAGAGFGAVSGTADGWAILRARRGRLIGNIIRKELTLQRPTFMAAAAFVACWLIALVVIQMRSRPAALGEILLPLLIGSYISLVVALAGTISAGEDGALGIKAWHLTLPVSARRQWAVKLVVALVVGIVLATAVPWLMVAVADLVSKGHVRTGPLFQPSFVVFVAGAVVLAFWASTLLGDTVKASVATGGVILVMAFAANNAIDWSMTAGRHAEWLVRLVGLLHVSPRNGRGIVPLALDLFVLTVGLTALWQSRSAYPRLRTSSTTFLRLALVLLVVAFVTSFCLGIFLTALELSFQRAQPVLNSIQ